MSVKKDKAKNGLSRRVIIVISDELIDRIGEWRRKQKHLPNMSQAIRDLIERGLK